jgi:hypothetical protein
LIRDDVAKGNDRFGDIVGCRNLIRHRLERMQNKAATQFERRPS